MVRGRRDAGVRVPVRKYQSALSMTKRPPERSFSYGPKGAFVTMKPIDENDIDRLVIGAIDHRDIVVSRAVGGPLGAFHEISLKRGLRAALQSFAHDRVPAGVVLDAYDTAGMFGKPDGALPGSPLEDRVPTVEPTTEDANTDSGQPRCIRVPPLP